jgi:hypothetical protein
MSTAASQKESALLNSEAAGSTEGIQGEKADE